MTTTHFEDIKARLINKGESGSKSIDIVLQFYNDAIAVLQRDQEKYIVTKSANIV